MERLWRPWRMAYIKGGAPDDGCFLCRNGNDPSGDEQNFVLARGPHAYVLLNAFPYNTGHLMVAPYRHVGELEDLTADESGDVWSLVSRSITAHKRTATPDGFNVGLNLGRVAGAGVPGHLHVHVVPRWGGDTNFMTVVGGAKVLPESLADSWRTLSPAF